MFLVYLLHNLHTYKNAQVVKICKQVVTKLLSSRYQDVFANACFQLL
jgi:hypothetical protein